MDYDQSRPPPPKRTISDPPPPSRKHIIASSSFHRTHGAPLERHWSERIEGRVVLNSNFESGNENTRKPIFDTSSIHLPNLSRLPLKRDAPTDSESENPEKRDFKRWKSSTSEVLLSQSDSIDIGSSNSVELSLASTTATSTQRKSKPTDPASEGKDPGSIEPPKKRRKLRRRMTTEGWLAHEERL